MDDRFDLHRFVDAQGPVIDRVMAELRGGQKRSHWMWFVFPQISGLGNSPMAKRFAISGLDEARAYLSHAILGLRLRDCTKLVLQTERRSIYQILGSPDDLKFRSSMTLFANAAANTSDDQAIFERALDQYFDGAPDLRTLDRLPQ